MNARSVRMEARLLLVIMLSSSCLAEGTDAPGTPPATCQYGFYWKDSFAPVPASPGQTRAPLPERASQYRVEVVAGDFNHPWSLAFLPDGRMLVTERIGRMRVVDRNGRVSPPIAGLPAMKNGPPGSLWDLVLDPDFPHNRYVYFNYFSPPAGPALSPDEAAERWAAWVRFSPAERRGVDAGTGHVARARLSGDTTHLEQFTNLVDGTLDGRLRFGTDGTLFITSGTPAGAGIPSDGEPQDLENAFGKVLRVRQDGSIPADNPFVGRKRARPDLYSYGARDIQGAAIRPGSGDLWSSENGPRGGDEINRHRPGANFGYPIVSYGREYSGSPINGGLTARDGLAQPVYFWTPSIAPSGMTFYDGTLFPEWRGNLLVAALAGKRIERLVLEGDRVVAEEPLLLERCQRMRAVYQGPDGALYVLTDEDAGQLLRVVPVGAG
jgi:glucose/arabinose dehydrogenase